MIINFIYYTLYGNNYYFSSKNKSGKLIVKIHINNPIINNQFDYLITKPNQEMPKKLNSKNYTKITKQQRIQLLSLIIDGKSSIKQAADFIGIGPSTARTILKKYQQTGDIFQSKRDAQIRKDAQNRKDISVKLRQKQNPIKASTQSVILPEIQQQFMFIPVIYYVWPFWEYPTYPTYPNYASYPNLQ